MSRHYNAFLVAGVIGIGTALLFPTCRPAPPGSEASDLIILQTGRLRGNVFPAEGIEPPSIQYYPYISGYVKRVRDEAKASGAAVVVVDLGDSLTGSLASHVTNSGNMVSFFNAVGYDAVALGNLDADMSADAAAGLRMPVLVPFVGEDGKPPVAGGRHYVEIDTPKGKVAIVPNFYGLADPGAFPGRFPAFFGEAAGVAPLRDYAGLVAAHSGWRNAAIRLVTWMKLEPGAPGAIEFAREIRKLGADAAIAHRIYTGESIETWAVENLANYGIPVSLNILRMNSGFSVARIDLKRDHGGAWREVRRELVPMTANSAGADTNLAKAIDAQFGRVMREADRSLARLEVAVSKDELMRIALHVLAEAAECDAVIYSKESVRGDLAAGELRLSRLFEAIPWRDPIVVVGMPAETLQRIKADGRLTVVGRTGLTGTVRVATTRFFARFLARGYGLAERDSVPVGADAFFEVLAAQIEAHHAIPPVADREGWDYAF